MANAINASQTNKQSTAKVKQVNVMFPFTIIFTLWLVPVATFFIGAGVFGIAKYINA
jgi:hypothetical protein